MTFYMRPLMVVHLPATARLRKGRGGGGLWKLGSRDERIGRERKPWCPNRREVDGPRCRAAARDDAIRSPSRKRNLSPVLEEKTGVTDVLTLTAHHLARDRLDCACR